MNNCLLRIKAMKNIKKITYCFLFFFCFTFLMNVNMPVYAFFGDDLNQKSDASMQVFENLESDFLRLRNSDPKVEKVGEWETLARKFEVFFDKNERLSQSAVGIYNATILYEELYKKTQNQKYLDRAFIIIEKFFKDYANHYLADDILVKKGDLYLFLTNDLEKAKDCYEDIIENYENGDMFELAKARLKIVLDRKNNNADHPIIEQIKNNGGEDKFTQASHIIVLDPGHGGEEGGAKNIDGLLEKDLTLDIALRLEKILNQNTGFRVFLTRRTDKFVSLGERTELANDKDADLFISLHVNASPNKSAYGIETYYLDNTDDKSSRKLAERENKSLTFGSGKIDDLQFMLSDLIQSAKQEESIVLANNVQDELVKHLDKKWRGIKNLGVKKAPFYVLVGAHMPCILVETLFIDNYQDAKKLSNENFRQDIAHALYVAILRFFDQK